jgi:hypothetical protein
MKDELNEDSNALPPNVHFESLEGGKHNLGFDQILVSIDLSSTLSLEKIILNEVVLEHVDTKVTSMIDIKIDSREDFQHLYSKTSYSLYPDLITIPSGMLITHDDFTKHLAGNNSLNVQFGGKMQLKDEKLDGGKLLSSSELPSIDKI